MTRGRRIRSHHGSSSTCEGEGGEPTRQARNSGGVEVRDERDGKLASGRADDRTMKLAMIGPSVYGNSDGVDQVTRNRIKRNICLCQQ